jgi:hypothetical protein
MYQQFVRVHFYPEHCKTNCDCYLASYIELPTETLFGPINHCFLVRITLSNWPQADDGVLPPRHEFSART